MKNKLLTLLLSIVVAVSCSPTAFPDTSEDTNEVEARAESTLENTITEYIKTQDATIELPIIGSQLTLDSKNIDEGELNLKLKMSDTKEVEEGKSRKKHKLKKLFVPIFVIILLKVITLIPLALGILGLKTWNALQLSFVTFVISISMAVYQLCKKIANDNAVPTIAAHGPWSAHKVRRSLEDDEAQKMAYSAYAF